MAALLDVNVLVALAWPNHIHHTQALRWFEKHHSGGWSTCPVTQSGFVRVSSNTRVVPEARSPAEAIIQLRRMIELEGHEFWLDDVALAASKFVAPDRIYGYRQVTDAHLMAVALRHGGKLATFDRGIAQVVPSRVDPSEVLIFLA